MRGRERLSDQLARDYSVTDVPGLKCYLCNWLYSEGVVRGDVLFYLSPHPNLLPEGEGIAPMMQLRDFMSSTSSDRLGVRKISSLSTIAIMLTGQQ